MIDFSGEPVKVTELSVWMEERFDVLIDVFDLQTLPVKQTEALFRRVGPDNRMEGMPVLLSSGEPWAIRQEKLDGGGLFAAKEPPPEYSLHFTHSGDEKVNSLGRCCF